MTTEGEDVDDAARRVAGAVAGGFGVALHVMVGIFVAGTAELAPAWVAVVLAAVWALLLVLLWRWRRTRPLLTLLVPFVAAGIWWAAVTASQRWSVG